MSGPRMDRERWAKLDIYEQLGNIGSEVGRAINAKRAGEGYEDRLDGAVKRALDLFLATIECLIKDPAQTHRAKEVIRARDEFMAIMFNGRFDEADKILAYFMNFAYIARTRVLEERARKAGL